MREGLITGAVGGGASLELSRCVEGAAFSKINLFRCPVLASAF